MSSPGSDSAAATTAAAAGPNSNPRKFSEKIALIRQKEAEEKSQFEAVMHDINVVRGEMQQQRGTVRMYC